MILTALPQTQPRRPMFRLAAIGVLAGCLSLATAVATFCDQQVNQERPLLSATLPSGERIQFVIPPAVPRGTVSITVRKPSNLIKRLEDFERRFEDADPAP